MRNAQGTTIEVIPFGAILASVKTADREGRFEEVTLGFDSLNGYLGKHPFFGATVGRAIESEGRVRRGGNFSIARGGRRGLEDGGASAVERWPAGPGGRKTAGGRWQMVIGHLPAGLNRKEI